MGGEAEGPAIGDPRAERAKPEGVKPVPGDLGPARCVDAMLGTGRSADTFAVSEVEDNRRPLPLSRRAAEFGFDVVDSERIRKAV